MKIREPTSDQCTQNAKVYETEARVGYAIWYPQMGGYIGRAIAIMDKVWEVTAHGATSGGCIDILVWHDGEFPFDGEGGRQPREIHHCDPDQFTIFGTKLSELNSKGMEDVSSTP
jgi:hypothetical protein